MSGIARLAAGIEAELGRRLPGQRKTQRGKLALLVASRPAHHRWVRVGRHLIAVVTRRGGAGEERAAGRL